jgi:hypothetical protein
MLTDGDLRAISQLLDEKLEQIKGPLDQKLERMEKLLDQERERTGKLLDHEREQMEKLLDAKLEQLETRLLTAFHGWASPVDARIGAHAAVLHALDLEREAMKQRRDKLDGGSTVT